MPPLLILDGGLLREKTPAPHNPRFSLDAVEMHNLSYPCLESNPGCPACRAVATVLIGKRTEQKFIITLGVLCSVHGRKQETGKLYFCMLDYV